MSAMGIRVTLDRVLARRGMRARQLAQMIDITEANLSLLRTGKVRGIRFATLSSICAALNCQPGDLLVYEPDTAAAPLSEYDTDAA